MIDIEITIHFCTTMQKYFLTLKNKHINIAPLRETYDQQYFLNTSYHLRLSLNVDQGRILTLCPIIDIL